MPGDYDGDGKTDLATWRPSTGVWSIEFSTGAGVVAHPWGAQGDLPVPADYDGDGITDLAFFRPSTAVWYISNAAGQNGYYFGLPGDVPVPGDYDCDGKSDLAVWRPANGTRWVQFSSTGEISGPHPWGSPGDMPLASRGQSRLSPSRGELQADRGGIGKQERFVVARTSNGKTTLHASTGYFCADHTRSDAARADRQTIGAWESWDLINNADGTVSLRSDQGRYLSTDVDRKLRANRDVIGDWEKYWMQGQADGTIALKSCHTNQYVSAAP